MCKPVKIKLMFLSFRFKVSTDCKSLNDCEREFLM